MLNMLLDQNSPKCDSNDINDLKQIQACRKQFGSGAALVKPGGSSMEKPEKP